MLQSEKLEGQGMTVLLIEDDRRLAELVCIYLAVHMGKVCSCADLLDHLGVTILSGVKHTLSCEATSQAHSL